MAGEPVTGPPDRLAVVFQEYGRSLFPWLKVDENVDLPLKAKGVAQGRADRPGRAGARGGRACRGAATAWPWQLSGGMQQRVAIARALAYQPRVLLMDEPFAAVDAQTRADLEDLVRSVWQETGVTLLFVTHDIDESVYLGQRVVVLSSSPTTVVEDIADRPAGRARPAEHPGRRRASSSCAPTSTRSSRRPSAPLTRRRRYP